MLSQSVFQVSMIVAPSCHRTCTRKRLSLRRSSDGAPLWLRWCFTRPTPRVLVARGGLPASLGEGLRQPNSPGSSCDRRQASAATASFWPPRSASFAPAGALVPSFSFCCCSVWYQGDPIGGGGRVSTIKAGKLPSPMRGDGRRLFPGTRPWWNSPTPIPAPDALRARRKALSQFIWWSIKQGNCIKISHSFKESVNRYLLQGRREMHTRVNKTFEAKHYPGSRRVAALRRLARIAVGRHEEGGFVVSCEPPVAVRRFATSLSFGGIVVLSLERLAVARAG